MAPEPNKADLEHERDYIQFDVVSEPWCRYKLSDGTFLRTRFVLLRMKRTPSPDPSRPRGAAISSQVLAVVEPPAKFRGTPGPGLQLAEMESTLEADVTFETLEEAPSVYRFEDERKLIVNARIASVRRSSAFGPEGDRQYSVVTTAEMAVMGGPVPTEGGVPPPSPASPAAKPIG